MKTIYVIGGVWEGRHFYYFKNFLEFFFLNCIWPH